MVEGREKPLWIDAAFTVLIGDWHGKETYTLIDERTGEKFSLFELEQKSDGYVSPLHAAENDASAGQQDDVPF